MRLETVQQRAAEGVTHILQRMSEIPISVGAVQVQHLNKVVIKKIALNDEKGDTALSIPQITAHLSPLYMLKGDIRINTLIIGEPAIRLHRETAGAPLNIQFILDKLTGDTAATEKQIPNLRINQIQIYDGSFTYDIGDEEEQPSTFDPAHIHIKNIACNLSLKKLNSDTLSLYIRSISGCESKGLCLNRLSAKIRANKTEAGIEEVKIELPHSRLTSEKITITAGDKGKPHINGTLYAEKITPADFAPFLPELASEGLPCIELRATINSNNQNTNGTATIATADKSLALQINARTKTPLKSQETTINIINGEITPKAIFHIQKILNDNTNRLDILKNLGRISLAGTSLTNKNNEITGNLILDSEAGSATGQTTIHDRENYATTLDIQNLELGKILNNRDFGSCDIAASLQSTPRKGSKPEIKFETTINSFTYNGYTYSPIAVNGTYNAEQIETNINCNDQNISGNIACTFIQKEQPEITLKANIDSIKPKNLNIGNREQKISVERIEGRRYFNRDNEPNLNISIYNIAQETEEKRENISQVHIIDNYLFGNRRLIINSDFLNAEVAGQFNYQSLTGTFKTIARTHLPALFREEETVQTKNFYTYSLNIKNTATISSLLGLPVTIRNKSTVTGQCDDNRKLFQTTAKLSGIDIQGREFNSIDAAIVSNDNKIALDATLITPQKIKNKEKEITIKIKTTAQDNSVTSILDWENDTTPVNRGKIDLGLSFARVNDQVSTYAQTTQSDIIYNDALWTLSECNITGTDNNIAISNLHFSNGKKNLLAQGVLSKSSDDIFNIELNDIDVETILDIVNFHSVEFGGDATGNITISRALENPQFGCTLQVDSFSFEKGYMGDLAIDAEWDEEAKAVTMQGEILTPLGTKTTVQGLVSPANDTINLLIGANRTSLAFLNSMLDGIISDVKATATGEISVVGPLGSPNLIGKAVARGPLRVVATNTVYTLQNDTINLTHNKIALDRCPISDQHGNTGRITGSIDHEGLDDFTCDLDITANKLLAYDSEEFGENPFHGKAFVTGDANITANDKGLFIHADIRSEENSSFVYDATEIGSSANNNFIKIVDRNKKQTSPLQKEKKSRHKSLLSRLNLEFMIEITPDIQLRVYTNRRDHIDLYGNGPIRAVYDEKEGFSMKGRLDLDRGTYKFTIQDIFPKEFSITKGSTLDFNGDPFLADLNLKTKYLVPSASLGDLDPAGKHHDNVKVHCLMDITGKLESPQLNFDIELPEASEEEREILAAAVNTPEQKNTQFIYLMGIGKFYTYDYNSSNAESSSAMESLISNTISGQLNNMLSRIIDNRNWNISGNFSSSERGWNSMEIEGILEGRLLNNRLLINGNFGYHENSLTNTNFVGDFEAQFRLDKNDRIRLKAYSKTNDRYFSDATLTTQGAGIILRHNFDDWRFWLRNNKKEEQTTEKEK